MATKTLHGLRSLIYSVTDLDRAKAWYSQVLGYAPYFDEPPYVGFNVGGFELGLLHNETPAPAGSAYAYWGVDDVDVEYARLLKLGAKEHTALMDVGGGVRLGTVLDPFGNILGIIYNPEFEVEA